MKKYFSALIVIYILDVLTGCKPLYEGISAAQREECYRLEYPEQEDCLQQTAVGYEAYEKERREATRRQ